MAENSPFEVEDRDEITVLNVRRVERGLAVTDVRHMDRLWSILNNVAMRKPKVLLMMYDRDVLGPERTDEAWQDIMASAPSGREQPPAIRAAQSNLRKLIDYYANSRTLCIGAFEGAIDFDL